MDELVFDRPFRFDESVTDCFDDMLRRSIPEHDAMRELVSVVGERYVVPGTKIVDVGCSWGEAVLPFVERHNGDNTFVLCDTSEPMLDMCRQRFSPIDSVTILNRSVCDGLGVTGASLVLSVLTVQFTPIERRQGIIRCMHDSLIDGGALIYVEKVLGDTSSIDSMMVDCYYERKRANGYTREQIESKRVSLEGVLVPITAKWNEDLLRKAGFSEVDCFWRSLNFAGWVAVK